MSFRCDNCGSRNHLARDCSKVYNGWREREPAVKSELAQEKAHAGQEVAKPEVKVAQAAKTDWESLLGNRTLSPPLPTRRTFPFLREPTRRAIEERARRMMPEQRIGKGDLPSSVVDRSIPVALPKVEKKKLKQQGLLC